MQQDRQIQDLRMLQLLEDPLVGHMRRLRGIQHPVQMFHHMERVLVGRVLMKKLVLDQTRQLAELRDKFPEKFHLVHQPQHAGHLAFLLEDRQKSFARLRRTLKPPIDPLEVLPDQGPQIGT